MERSFKLFEDYGIGIRQAIEQICHLDNMGDEDKLNVLYATPPLAFAKFKLNIVNGEDPGPMVSFFLKGIEVEKEQTMNGYGTLNVSNPDGSIITMRAPQICSLQYQATIFCNNETEGDILQAQLLMGMPFNRNYYFMVNNQYASCYATDPENETTVEAGAGKDKIVRRTLTIVMPRAYLEYPIREIRSFIKEFNIRYNVIGGSEGGEGANDLISTFR